MGVESGVCGEKQRGVGPASVGEDLGSRGPVGANSGGGVIHGCSVQLMAPPQVGVSQAGCLGEYM